ncbi:hypothetical protein F183_A08780 [Bryobacterales bacterium F-183]|nr:hypothetical protein F183_A08780 [Bryobacterales bacterium F-183]
MLWKTDLPAGHGSPCVARDRVFVTAFTASSKTLETIALNRSSGAIVWRHTIPAPRIETVHPTSSPATSTPVTDGKRVFVYSGSYGLIAYEWDGSVAWTYPMEVAKSPFGSGTSPVLAGDFVVFTRDYMPTPSLFALRKTDGSLAWKTTLAQSTLDGAKAAHSTPLIWNNQIVLCRPGTLSAYKIEDGSPLWWFPQASAGTSTPTFGADILYWNAPGFGGDLFTVPKPPPFTEALAKYDANGDGKLARAELPEKDLYFVRRAGVSEDTPGAHVTLRTAWVYFDENKDNFLDAREYQGFMEAGNNIPPAAAGVLALRPGTGTGALPADALVWQEKRNAPEVSTALEYRGRVYSVSSGGIISCLDAKTGTVVYRGRVNAPGNYWASPVAGGGKIFLASADGVVTVLGGGDRLEVLANNDLGDPIQGTPALAGSTIYIRSNNALWAFGKP